MASNNSPRRQRRTTALVITLITLLTAIVAGTTASAVVPPAPAGTRVLALGRDLSTSQQNEVRTLLKAPAGVKTTMVTNQEEHAYLGAYVPANIIGNHAISSVLVEILPAGAGIKVELHNITWATKEMFTSVLATAGVRDARVTAAAPFAVSGTAALTGMVKAFETATNSGLPGANKNAAVNELYQAGKLGEEIKDKDKATRIIVIIKERIVTSGAKDPAQIRDIIVQVAREQNITLTNQQLTDLQGLMEQIEKLNLNINDIRSQIAAAQDKIQQAVSNARGLGGMWRRFVAWWRSMLQVLMSFFNR